MVLPDDRRSRSAAALHRPVVRGAHVAARAGEPTALGGPASRFNASGGGNCAAGPHDMRVPTSCCPPSSRCASAALCGSRSSEQESASCTGCLGRPLHSMAGSERYATACRGVPQRPMRSVKRWRIARMPSCDQTRKATCSRAWPFRMTICCQSGGKTTTMRPNREMHLAVALMGVK